MNRTVFEPATMAKLARADEMNVANSQPYSVAAIPYSQRQIQT